MAQWVEDELVIPTGPYEGMRYRLDRQPFNRLWFEAIDSGQWRRFFATGPTQSSKSLTGYVAPSLYHLFEMREDVICGVPSREMVNGKWKKDFLPVIQRTRYRELLPTGGEGSRGGDVAERVRFRNGRELRFMTAGSGDKGRAGETSRILVVTEVDGFDERGSREADKFTQLEARALAHGDNARIYGECTVSTEAGRIWHEYTQGTHSRIVICCPHCQAWVTPEREHLVGWQDAPTELAAKRNAGLACPACAAMRTEAQRRQANGECRLVHEGQQIDAAGVITGSPKETETLGFRWTAANNLLVSMGVVAMKEWKGHRAQDEENAELELRQFCWTMPALPAKQDLSQIHAAIITQRQTQDPRGRVPAGCRLITVGIDVGKWYCHWVATGWAEHATPHVIEYGVLEVPSGAMAEEIAILCALRDFRDRIAAGGWPAEGSSMMRPAMVFVDSGYKPDKATDNPVYVFCAESGFGWWPAKGIGETQSTSALGEKNMPRGDGWGSSKIPGRKIALIDVNADYWKSFVHARLTTPMGQPGAMTLFAGEHFSFAKHLTAEKKVEEFVAGRGVVIRWVAVHRNNHYFDATALSCAAANALKQKLVQEENPEAKTPPAAAAPVKKRENKWLDRG